jgi:protein-L-isoaspartate(D-aspartate) O-methyltransferase
MARILSIAAVVLATAGCTQSGAAPPDRWSRALEATGVRDGRVYKVMEEVRRRDFLPEAARRFELEDRPIPIGSGQTTSQPSLIARMIEELELKSGCRVLEVGTGSGYQTALLARLCDRVHSVEIVEDLAKLAKERLARLGYENAHVKAGDGYLGWPEAAPFDGIVVCAATSKIPQPLIDQLKPGGRLVIPLEDGAVESLVVITKEADGKLSRREVLPVRFVPLTGPNAEQDRAR